MRIPLAKYGIRELILFGLPCIVGMGFSIVLFPWLVPIPLFFLSFLFNFFRDPNRKTPQDTLLIIAPADGTVSHIVPAFEDNYLKCDATKISIFMSVLNVHVNRVPVHGLVEFIKHTKGIVCACKVGDVFEQGQRFGMIKFGSRVEVFVPNSIKFEVMVKVGDKVTAGKTRLCKIYYKGL